jgi:hypothetical protein
MAATKPKFVTALLSLDNGNEVFPMWEEEILSHCLAKKCGHLLLAPPTTDMLTSDDFIVLNSMAKSFMLSATTQTVRIHADVITLLRDTSVTAFEMMAKLKALCTNTSPNAILTARFQLDKAAKLEAGQTPTQCLDNIDTRAAELAYMGKPVDPSDVALLYLRALRPKFPSFVDQFHGGSETTVANIRQRLAFQAGLSDDNYENEQASESVFSSAVVTKTKEITLESLYAAIERLQRSTAGGRGGGGGGRGSSSFGGFSGGRGGGRYGMNGPLGLSPLHQRRYDEGLCFNCGKPGHIKTDCPKPLPPQGAAEGINKSQHKSYLSSPHCSTDLSSTLKSRIERIDSRMRLRDRSVRFSLNSLPTDTNSDVGKLLGDPIGVAPEHANLAATRAPDTSDAASANAPVYETASAFAVAATTHARDSAAHSEFLVDSGASR